MPACARFAGWGAQSIRNGQSPQRLSQSKNRLTQKYSPAVYGASTVVSCHLKRFNSHRAAEDSGCLMAGQLQDQDPGRVDGRLRRDRRLRDARPLAVGGAPASAQRGSLHLRGGCGSGAAGAGATFLPDGPRYPGRRRPRERTPCRSARVGSGRRHHLEAAFFGRFELAASRRPTCAAPRTHCGDRANPEDNTATWADTPSQ